MIYNGAHFIAAYRKQAATQQIHVSTFDADMVPDGTPSELDLQGNAAVSGGDAQIILGASGQSAVAWREPGPTSGDPHSFMLQRLDQSGAKVGSKITARAALSYEKPALSYDSLRDEYALFYRSGAVYVNASTGGVERSLSFPNQSGPPAGPEPGGGDARRPGAPPSGDETRYPATGTPNVNRNSRRQCPSLRIWQCLRSGETS